MQTNKASKQKLNNTFEYCVAKDGVNYLKQLNQKAREIENLTGAKTKDYVEFHKSNKGDSNGKREN